MVGVLERNLFALPPAGPLTEDLRDSRRILYGFDVSSASTSRKTTNRIALIDNQPAA
jgi:hypothetical protein